MTRTALLFAAVLICGCASDLNTHVLRTDRLELVGKDGVVVAIYESVAGRPTVALCDENGNPRAALSLDKEGNIDALLYDEQGRAKTGRLVPDNDLGWEYVQVDLGSFTRGVPGDKPGVVECFTVEIALVLNPKAGDLEELKKDVASRKNYLADIINRNILFVKNPEEFRKANFLNALATEILQTLNEELGPVSGEKVIRRVIYTRVISIPSPK